MQRQTVVVGQWGTQLDGGDPDRRWERWRPSIALCQQPDLRVDRYELLVPHRKHEAARREEARIREDLLAVSPETDLRFHPVDVEDPWDFETVFESLYEISQKLDLDPRRDDVLVHITTGTHVSQICVFLLTETRHFPGRLIQTSPPLRRDGSIEGRYSIIDLDLSRYDRIAMRFSREHQEARDVLKSGIATRNERFNTLIDRIESVAIRSRDPILLMGPTGAGKSHLGKRMFELKAQRGQVRGGFVELNCATLRGDAAMSTLFGHVAGAFTGAESGRSGLLRSADGGVLFLDEIGELGLDEQAMLLRAIEEKAFFPLGSDVEVSSDFQLFAGTHRDLREAVAEGLFREDLLARIDLWTFRLPSLADRREDIEPNLDYELEKYARRHGTRVTFNREARREFLTFAASPAATWKGNFRDLNAAVTRMATLAPGGRIRGDNVREEIERLESSWRQPTRRGSDEALLREAFHASAGAGASDPAVSLPTESIPTLDRFDAVQLAEVIRVCRDSPSLSAAGRALFHESRARKKAPNDADRLRKYLARFGLSWEAVQG